MLAKDILTWIVDHMLSELERALETAESSTNFIDGTTPEAHSGKGWVVAFSLFMVNPNANDHNSKSLKGVLQMMQGVSPWTSHDWW